MACHFCGEDAMQSFSELTSGVLLLEKILVQFHLNGRYSNHTADSRDTRRNQLLDYAVARGLSRRDLGLIDLWDTCRLGGTRVCFFMLLQRKVAQTGLDCYLLYQ